MTLFNGNVEAAAKWMDRSNKSAPEASSKSAARPRLLGLFRSPRKTGEATFVLSSVGKQRIKRKPSWNGFLDKGNDVLGLVQTS